MKIFNSLSKTKIENYNQIIVGLIFLSFLFIKNILAFICIGYNNPYSPTSQSFDFFCFGYPKIIVNLNKKDIKLAETMIHT